MESSELDATAPPGDDETALLPSGDDPDAVPDAVATPAHADASSAPHGAIARIRAAVTGWLQQKPRQAGFASGAFLIVFLVFVASAFGVGAPGQGDSESLELTAPSVFHPLPTLVTDIRPGRHSPYYIKLDVVLEVSADVVPRIEQREAAILDAMRSVLRDYDRKDLVGTAGARRVRRDLTVVVDQELEPAQTQDVLFTQFVLD